MTYTGFPTIFLRKLIKAGFAMVTLMSLPALASFETMFNAQTYAYHQTGILANPVVDDHRYDFPNSGVRLGNAQTGISNAAASGIFLLPFGSNLLAQVNGGIAQARGTADNGLVRAYAFADTGPPKYYPSIQPGTTLPYSAPVFNTGAESSVSANTYTRNTVMGATGSTGLATFSGFVEGSIIGNGALIGRDPYFPLNSRTAAVGARFIFGASSTTFAGFDCFASGAGCNSTGVTLNFGAALSTTDNGVYQVPFSVSLAVNAGEELQTWLSMEVFAQSIGVASFENTARLIDIVLSDGLSLDTSDGLLARNGNQYTLLSTLAEVVPPPLGVPEPATWSLMLAGLAACALRARKPRLSKWETLRLAKQTMGALALGVAVSQAAHAAVLTFSGFACTGAPGFEADRNCVNGDPIGRDYGDSVGVNVFYDSANDRGSAATVFLQGLYYTDGAVYGNLVDALHGIVPGYLPRIGLYALPGYNVTLTGFDLASNQQASDTRFRIYDYNLNLLMDSGDVQIAGFGQTRTNFNIGLTSGFSVVGVPQALIFELDNINGFVALDNLNFSFALAPTAVPEPGTALLFGLGLVGLLTSRKLRQKAIENEPGD